MAYIRYRRARRAAGGYRVRGRRMRLRPGGMAAARARLGRYNPTPTFTETYVGNPIPFQIQGTSPSGASIAAGLIQVALNDIPQVAQYTSLYNQYCIRKVTAIMMPAYNVYDQPATGSSVTHAPRLVTAIQDSAQQVAPTSELDVLQDNSAKIKMFTKPCKFSWRPVAAVGNTAVTGGALVAESRKNRWLSTEAITVAHAGLAFAFTTDTPVTNPATTVLANVYFKVTFSLKDPK